MVTFFARRVIDLGVYGDEYGSVRDVRKALISAAYDEPDVAYF